MTRAKISEAIREAVSERANLLCEYCHTDERWQYVRFTIDHVTPDANDDLENLALACFHCNRRKSNRTEAVDPATKQTVEIFNPRRHSWKIHFAWSVDKLRIVPKTAIGRATEKLLELNRERILAIRKEDAVVNRHPPFDDLD